MEKKTIIDYEKYNCSKIAEKIKTKEEISEIILKLRENNSTIKIVTTNGAFDLLHIGHVNSLVMAKSFGDILVVGLNSDKSIKSYKSSDRPIIPEKERAEMLANLEIVDYVVIFDELDPREFIKAVKPNFHVKSKEGYKGIEGEVVGSSGGKIVLVEHQIEGYHKTATTDIIERIKKLT